MISVSDNDSGEKLNLPKMATFSKNLRPIIHGTAKIGIVSRVPLSRYLLNRDDVY